MGKEIIIVGGGLSGLTAAWQLSLAGHSVKLLEARNRFGGRAWTQADRLNSDSEMGPSWFWRGQPLVANLLDHFGIDYFEQYSDGLVLFQQADGSVGQAPIDSPMGGDLRINGGISKLVNAIAQKIAPADQLLEHVVTAISLKEKDGLITVEGTNPKGNFRLTTDHVAIAIPPRLGASLEILPKLPGQALSKLNQTPTWMAGHAKFFAIYDQPFWRTKGLSGTTMSRRGPLAEIHDASPESGEVFSLFGFVGIDATQRASLGRDAVIQHVLDQLGTVYGEEAREPKQVYLQDWTTEPFTAGPADRQSLSHHPEYGLNLDLRAEWQDRLAFISAETSFTNGGLIEGALESGVRYAQQITALAQSQS